MVAVDHGRVADLSDSADEAPPAPATLLQVMDEPAETGTASKDCIFSSTKNCLILKSHFVQWQWQEKAEPDGSRTAATSSSGCEDCTFFFKRWRLNLKVFSLWLRMWTGLPPPSPEMGGMGGFNFLVWDTVLATHFTCWILTSFHIFFRRKSKQAVELRTAHPKKKVMFELTYCFWFRSMLLAGHCAKHLIQGLHHV